MRRILKDSFYNHSPESETATAIGYLREGGFASVHLLTTNGDSVIK